MPPQEIRAMAGRAGLTGWVELAAFYARYLDVLNAEGVVDFAGLVNQAAVAAAALPGDAPMFYHPPGDAYKEGTVPTAPLPPPPAPGPLVVARGPGGLVGVFP